MLLILLRMRSQVRHLSSCVCDQVLYLNPSVFKSARTRRVVDGGPVRFRAILGAGEEGWSRSFARKFKIVWGA